MEMRLAYELRVGLAMLVATLLVPTTGVFAASAEENKDLALDVATLFRAARGAISANQALINDASKGDKGLTGDKVIAEAKANYEKATGHPLVEADVDTLAGQAQQAMFDTITEVMAGAQPLINEEGKGFKGFLPAVFARMLAEGVTKRLDSKLYIKLTAPKSYVRNRRNRPDKWEENAIESRFKSAGWEKGESFTEEATHKGKAGFRLILPEYYGASCLKCHGEPKGELDVTGGKKEGGVLDELGGAISVVIYQ